MKSVKQKRPGVTNVNSFATELYKKALADASAFLTRVDRKGATVILLLDSKFCPKTISFPENKDNFLLFPYKLLK